MAVPVHALLFVALLAVCPSAGSAQASWLTYRDTVFDFRILYPPEWLVTQPRGENVRFAVYAPGTPSPATCNTVVRRDPLLDGMTQDQLNAMISRSPLSEADWTEIMGGQWPDFVLLETRLTRVHNRPAYLGSAEFGSETVDRMLHFKNIMIYTLSPGLLWIHSCAARGTSRTSARANYDRYEACMRRILGSLVFETWSDKGSLRPAHVNRPSPLVR